MYQIKGLIKAFPMSGLIITIVVKWYELAVHQDEPLVDDRLIKDEAAVAQMDDALFDGTQLCPGGSSHQLELDLALWTDSVGL